jgi:hypothetical protein
MSRDLQINPVSGEKFDFGLPSKGLVRTKNGLVIVFAGNMIWALL